MEKTTVSKLKSQLSAYLRMVKSGATILVFERDQPIARIEAVRDSGKLDDRLSRLERAGLVRRGTKPVPLKVLRKQVPKSKRSVTKALIDERRESR
jgi:antitoxin (DNA-binding transcriptional repressor) of toxin-antitoxin stability system